MPVFLLGWRLYVAIAGLIAFAGFGLYINHIFNEAAKVPGLELQIVQLQKDKDQCSKDKLITEGASHDYQVTLSNTLKQLHDYKLQHPARCIVPITGQANGLNGSSSQAINAGTYGIGSGWLLDFSNEAEQYRLQVIGLQKFINDTWAR